MKTTKFKLMTIVLLMILGNSLNVHSQTKPLTAVLGIESKGVIQDPEAVSFMFNVELEKVGEYTLLDKYEIIDILKRNNLEGKNCFSKSCILAAGKALKVDKVITGNVDRFGEKIIITVKEFDIKSESVEKTVVTEFLNLQPELQKMIMISLQKLAGQVPDQALVDLLINFETPIESPKTKLSLSGPRMGATFVTGDAGKVLTAAEVDGGYNMWPAMFNIGWQQEWQYLSSGNFQALVEGIGFIGGLESGRFIPSLTFLNGFRVGKSGWEFAFGPSFRIIQKASGFFGDGNNGTETGKWYLESDRKTIAPLYTREDRLDSRGDVALSTSMIFAVGKTFRSGYLNIPVNVYVSPRKEGTMFGFTFGFNIYRKPNVE
jgi:hypothetical protein